MGRRRPDGSPGWVARRRDADRERGLSGWNRVRAMTSSEAPLAGFNVIILAGGPGSRLWPLSRTDRPKFLLDLTGTGRSLLQLTWQRMLEMADADRIHVVTGHKHADAVAGQLPDLRPGNLLTEP